MGTKRVSKRQKPKYDNIIEVNTFKKRNVEIVPKNKNQEFYLNNLMDPSKDVVFGVGPAGTGKTLLAVSVAIKLFKERQVDKIIITRPAVSTDENLGFLPGTLEEKMAPWTRPILDVFKEYFSSYEIEEMMKEGIIEIAPFSYMRGRTFKNAYIIADECQSCTPNQMKMLLTRIGENSMVAVTGDLNQHEKGFEINGLRDFLERFDDSGRIKVVYFNHTDIERHPIVEEILRIYGDE